MMKKIQLSVAAAVSGLLLLGACAKTPTPEPAPVSTAPVLKSVSLQKSLNDFLEADVIGKIENGAKPSVSFGILPEHKDESFILSWEIGNADVIRFNDDELAEGEPAILFGEKDTLFVKNTEKNDSVAYAVSVYFSDKVAKLEKVFIEKVKDEEEKLNYDVDEISADMKVGLPADVKGKTVIVYFEKSLNDSILVNNVPYEPEAGYEFDTSFPINIEVRDTVDNLTAQYKLTIVNGNVKLTWSQVGSYKDGTAVGSYVRMAMDDKNSVPYIVYNYTEESVAYASVLKYTDNAFSVIGDKKATSGKASDMDIDAIDGKVYFTFTDGANSSKGSAMTYTADGWSLVGDAGFGDKVTGTSYYKTAMTLNPATSYPVYVLTANAANTTTGIGKRGLAVSMWNGTSWNANQAMPGRGTSADDYGYSPRLARTSNAVYLLVANQTLKNYSLYKYTDNSWICVVDKFAIPNASGVGTYQLALAADNKDNLYALIGDNTTGVWMAALYIFDESGNTFKKCSNYIPGFDVSNRYCQFDLAFDASNNPQVVFLTAATDNHIKMISFDSENKAWGPVYDTEIVANNCYLSAANDKAGNVYAVFTVDNEGANEIRLWKGVTPQE